MKRVLFLAAVLFGWASVVMAAVKTPIYPVLSDSGIAGDNIFIFGLNGGNSVALSSFAVTAQMPEGIHVFQGTTNSSGANAWGIYYLQSDKVTTRPVDLSAYSTNGELRAWVNCTNSNFITFIQYPPDAGHPTGLQWQWNWNGYLNANLNQWVDLIIPLQSVPGYPAGTPALGNLTSPFGMIMNSPGTCYVDNVRYVNTPTPGMGADVFNVTVKDIATQNATGSFAWNNVSSNGWVKANQYIELQLDDTTDLTWGVQIYTNNKTGANSYTGAAGTNPAGLVNTSNRALTIPLAWSVKPSTNTPAAAAPIAADPNNHADLNSFQWIIAKDAMTPTIPTENTTAFVPGEIPVTVKNNVGIHFGQANTEIGPADAPNYIYLEANIGAALTQNTYTTTTLTIEYFSY